MAIPLRQSRRRIRTLSAVLFTKRQVLSRKRLSRRMIMTTGFCRMMNPTLPRLLSPRSFLTDSQQSLSTRLPKQCSAIRQMLIFHHSIFRLRIRLPFSLRLRNTIRRNTAFSAEAILHIELFTARRGRS